MFAFDRDLSSFRGEIISLLQDLSEEIKTIKKNQESSGLSLGGKRVAGAVKEIRRKGTEFLKSPKE